MTRAEREELRERSKYDNATIVGAEVRQLCAEVDRLEAERDAAQRALAEAQQQRDTLGGINEQLERSLTEAQARNVVLERAIKFAVSACYCDDRDGNCNPPESPWCDRCKRLSAAIEAPADDAALREFGLRCLVEWMTGRRNNIHETVDAVLRGSR
jgi:hypothetical protein